MADRWTADGVVFCRTLLRSHSGRGIVIATTPQEVVAAPLYVKYVKKAKEFRVHVFRGEVIDVQEKRKRREFDDAVRDTRIRNLANGYVYCRDNIVEPRELRDMAIAAVSRLGLDFGAVDIIYNARSDSCYVLEVNTAPGTEGATLEAYTNAVQRFLV